MNSDCALKLQINFYSSLKGVVIKISSFSIMYQKLQVKLKILTEIWSKMGCSSGSGSSMVFWKLLGLSVTKRSIQLGLLVLLKRVFCGTKFLESLLNRNSDITGSASSMIKSPASRKLSKVCKYQEHN